MGELRWFRLRRESRLLCSPLDSRERKVNGLTRSMKSIPTDKKTIAVTINGLCRPWLKSASKVLTPSSQLWWIWKPISDVYEFICIHCFLKARKERGLTPDLPPGPLCANQAKQQDSSAPKWLRFRFPISTHGSFLVICPRQRSFSASFR